MTVQPVMSAERAVFYRERSSYYYSPIPYTVVGGRVGGLVCWRAGGCDGCPRSLCLNSCSLPTAARACGALQQFEGGRGWDLDVMLLSVCVPMSSAGHRHCGDSLPIGAVCHHGGHRLLVRACPTSPPHLLPSCDQNPTDRPWTVAPPPLQDGGL